MTGQAQPAGQGAARTLARLGFERVELATGWLGRLGAWPPGQGSPDGRPLLDELAASAKPDLAARVLADLVAAHPEPDRLAARLRAEPGLRARTIALAAASRSLGGWLVAHPDEAERLGGGGHPPPPPSPPRPLAPPSPPPLRVDGDY